MEHVPKLGRPELLMKKNGAHPKIDKFKILDMPTNTINFFFMKLFKTLEIIFLSSVNDKNDYLQIECVSLHEKKFKI